MDHSQYTLLAPFKISADEKTILQGRFLCSFMVGLNQLSTDNKINCNGTSSRLIIVLVKNSLFDEMAFDAVVGKAGLLIDDINSLGGRVRVS